VDVGDGYEDSDEEIERHPLGTECAPKGARRFSEKYPDDGNNRAAAPASSQAASQKAIKFTPRYGSPSGDSNSVRCGLLLTLPGLRSDDDGRCSMQLRFSPGAVPVTVTSKPLSMLCK
jgi:hypothetical protein